MADLLETPTPDYLNMPATLDEARARARQRFKERLEHGEKIGNCDCGDDATPLDANAPRLTGVRFVDSGQVYYFDPLDFSLAVGDWVVVETSRGKEAARVVIAPGQVRQNTLKGELKPVTRKMSESDVERMQRFKRDAATAVKTFGQKIRERRLPMKPISAEYNFDGTHLILNFSSPDRVDFRELAKDLAAIFRCRIELRQVGPRDEARLLGGLGRCGRTLCCSSWLPVYPDISMNMAKTQDLPLNPGKVSGVCGRLLCCLSYENEQYRQMKAVMPRLGQAINSPAGPGMVVSMQILKELVTIRLDSDHTDHVFSSVDLGFKKPEPVAAPVQMKDAAPPRPVQSTSDQVTGDAPIEGDDASNGEAPRRRRRRGRGNRNRPAEPQA
jgi:cell fate regulator YaaT (PSP1 superfamily)